MNVYSQDEIDRIEKLKESNNNLEEFFTEKREEWGKKAESIFSVIAHKNLNATSYTKMIDAQSYALSYRQEANDEIAFFLNKRSKVESDLKKIQQDKFIFYSTGFQMKTGLGEKKILIDAHLGENERNMQIIETHIDYLREMVKTLESFQYSVKNIISLMDFLGQ